jgi:hypothetical protein
LCCECGGAGRQRACAFRNECNQKHLLGLDEDMR